MEFQGWFSFSSMGSRKATRWRQMEELKIKNYATSLQLCRISIRSLFRKMVILFGPLSIHYIYSPTLLRLRTCTLNFWVCSILVIFLGNMRLQHLAPINTSCSHYFENFAWIEGVKTILLTNYHLRSSICLKLRNKSHVLSIHHYHVTSWNLINQYF